jgi:GNAT superfamily N-acetyltransferase
MNHAPTLLTRAAGGSDAHRIATLCFEMGWPVSVSAVHERLVLLDRTEHAIGVAVRAREGLIGWVELHREESLLTGRRCRVTSLVVDERARRQGVGRALLAWAERWARTHGCEQLHLASGIAAQATHAFCRSLGWQEGATVREHVRRVTPLPALGFPTTEAPQARGGAEPPSPRIAR